MNPLFLLELDHTTVVPNGDAEKLVVLRVGNTRLYVGGVGRPGDVNRTWRGSQTAGVGCIAHVLRLLFIAYILALLLCRRDYATQQNDAKNEEHLPPPVERVLHCRCHSHTCSRRSHQKCPDTHPDNGPMLSSPVRSTQLGKSLVR